MFIDLNCDLGEGSGHDTELLALITTASVSCGFHAGDPQIAMQTIREATRLGVRVGAHPSFPDREHFGRREMQRTESEIRDDCVYQIGALAGLAHSIGVALSHVKPHGALYNQACRDAQVAESIIAAARPFELPIMAMPGTVLGDLVPKGSLIAEGFADRRYGADGLLIPRSQPNAMIEDAAEAAKQALRLVHDLDVLTLCVHGDNPHGVEFVKALREALTSYGFQFRTFACA